MGFCRGSVGSPADCVECGVKGKAFWRCRECQRFVCDVCTAVHDGRVIAVEITTDVASVDDSER